MNKRLCGVWLPDTRTAHWIPLALLSVMLSGLLALSLPLLRMEQAWALEIISAYPKGERITDVPPEGSVLFVISAKSSDPSTPLTYRWSVDGMVMGESPSFMYIPGVDDVGAHQVEVSVSNRNGEVCRQWTVDVRNFEIHVDSASHGAITPSGEPPGVVSAPPGSTVTFRIQPDECYRIGDVLVDGASIGPTDSYSFVALSNDHTITASFIPLKPYTITTLAGEHGSIEPAGAVPVPCGSSAAFKIVPEEGYEIQDVRIDGVSIGVAANPAFSKVLSDHTIVASFIRMPVIDAEAMEGGSISPSGSLHIKNGATQAFTISPDLGYFISDLLVDGDSVGAVESYMMQNVTTDRSIKALFVANEPPVADAGPDQSVAPGAVVVLSGANSVDTDDGIASFRWEQIDGPGATLSDPERARSIFIAPDIAEPQGAALVFRLRLADHGELESSDTCIVNVVRSNLPPVARAGFDQVASEGEIVVLDGSGSYDPDPNDRIVSYTWEQLDGPGVSISGVNTVQPSFAVEGFGQEEASLRFRLTVMDQGGLKWSDTCIVSIVAQNDPPIASVGPDQSVFGRAEVTLDGSKSSDAEGPIVSYRWSQTEGSPVFLSDPAAAQPRFVSPAVVGPEVRELTFLLTVTDGAGLRGTSICAVTVSSPIEVLAPQEGQEWRAGESQSISWSFADDSEPAVRIELLMKGSLVSVFAENAPTGEGGRGSYDWLIPASQKPGPDYRIRVTSDNTRNGGHTAISEPFTISEPSRPSEELPAEAESEPPDE